MMNYGSVKKEDIFQDKQFLMIGGSDSRLHLYRLKLENDSSQ